jgi:signal peptidase I
MPAAKARSEDRRAVPDRRIWPLVLSVLLPGAGHFAAGEYGRGFAIAAGIDVLAWLAVVAGALGAPWVAVSLLLLMWVARISICIDTRRVDGTKPRPRRWMPFALSAGLVVGLQVSATLRRLLLAEAYAVPGLSMSPTLLDGDRIMISELNVAASRGSLVVYAIPGEAGALQVKRVVGISGDSVAVDAAGLVVNGTPARTGAAREPCEGSSAGCALVHERLDAGEYVVRTTSPAYGRGSWHVPAGHVFVLGDNRNESRDSRYVGPIPLEAIIGKPMFVGWSHSADGVRWSRFFAHVR